jgi:hypothetical protein
MYLLVSGASKSVKKFADRPWIGGLIGPRTSVGRDFLRSLPCWAADNDCFQRFDEPKYLAMLDRCVEIGGNIRFVTLPDVVCNAPATLALCHQWVHEVRGRGLPTALVGQDGMKADEIPWDLIDAFFVGGSTRWKLHEGIDLAKEAKARGKWVHIGRVNTAARLSMCLMSPADSVDGSGFSKFGDAKLAMADRAISRLQHTAGLFQ